ncbi:MAG: histidine--tRNA ligase [Acutalibacteraceae bacterium]|nr:histidine--tRNA ligase [Acutalibacteraceae bacterium]
MAEINRAVKGTNDILPSEVYKWQFVENRMLETARIFGFNEIRVPVFEHTEVFKRSVGDTTDVVQKEMYTFDDKGGRSITLRPELTAGVIRSLIEKGLVNGPLPLKVCYIGGCYRYEKPQAGRLREFHQFGVECVGAAAPNADAEVIALARQVLDSIGIEKIALEINSIGCPECRKKYSEALKEYFKANISNLCDTCKDRLERNPMRILDCKSPVCKEIAANAPVVLDYLCDGCAEHFTQVKKHLDAAGIKYTVNPHIVRGLDYYTRTVFEFVSGDIGAQSTVCGGGRYDGLISQMGGQPTASLGFAMGIERLMLVLESQKTELPKQSGCDLFIAQMGEKAALAATALCNDLRADGFKVQTDICGKGLKAQMKYADKIGASFTMVLGDNELETEKANLKNMENGEITEVSLENLSEDLFSAVNSSAFDMLADSILKEQTHET